MASDTGRNHNHGGQQQQQQQQQQHQGAGEGLSPFVCACFTLNYLIGTGFLTLPWAFQVSGTLLSCVTMACTCVMANTASDYILSAMARADAKAVLEGSSDVGEASALLGDHQWDRGTNTNTNTSYQSVEVPRATTEHRVVLAKALAVEFDDDAGPLPQKNDKDDDNDDDYYKFVKAHGKLLVGTRKFELTELVCVQAATWATQKNSTKRNRCFFLANESNISSKL